MKAAGQNAGWPFLEISPGNGNAQDSPEPGFREEQRPMGWKVVRAATTFRLTGGQSSIIFQERKAMRGP